MADAAAAEHSCSSTPLVRTVERDWRMVIPAASSESQPDARYGHTALTCDDCMYIFGGYDQHGFCCDAIYRFSFVDSTWKHVRTTQQYVVCAARCRNERVAPRG